MLYAVVRAVAVAAALFCGAVQAAVQDYPSKPIGGANRQGSRA